MSYGDEENDSGELDTDVRMCEFRGALGSRDVVLQNILPILHGVMC